MSAREEILGRVRSAVAGVAIAPPVEPVASAAASDDIVDLFRERVEDYRAEVMRVEPASVGVAVARILEGIGSVVVPDGIPVEWTSQLNLQVLTDEGLDSRTLDAVGAVLTTAAVGIAITGTIVLDHGAGQGRRALSLVPDVHVCVVREDQLVADVGDAVARLSGAVVAGRPLTWISGPSATSDIELERVEGVHGPRRLIVVLVATPDGAHRTADE